MSRPCHVYDYEGEHLAAFPDWGAAHAWARLQVLMNGVPAPLEVEDRRRGVGCRVWADRCDTTSTDGGDLQVWPSGPSFVDGCVGVRGFSFTPPLPRSPN